MTTDAAPGAPRRTAARRYSEQVHVLVDETTRAYLIGLAVLAAKSGGYALPKESEQVRDLLDEAIAVRYANDPDSWSRAVDAGRRELKRRATAARKSA